MSILDLISRASDAGSPLPARHEAFAELVHRFQDMAFACAYAVLGDAYLAEDVAQESFVTAWQKLHQLREPGAFPGWFKRIVLNQCNRLTRGKRLQFVALESAAKKAAHSPSPEDVAERDQLLARVLNAIRALPDNQRLVTTLFYVNGYTQADIGDFLELPVSTVNKRLYTARQQLKENVDVYKNDLQKRRPSRDNTFIERVSARLRPLHSEDWLTVKTLAQAREATDTSGNELWMQRRQSFDEARYVRASYVAEDADSRQILGFGSIEQSVYLPRYRLFILTDPHRLVLGVGDLLLNRLMNDLKQANALTVSCREYTTQTEFVGFLESRGFVEVDRVHDLRLDVTNFDASAFLPAVENVKKRGITITTLAEERIRDPECTKRLHDLTCALHVEDPARRQFSLPVYNEREANLWLNMPYVLPDAYFIARQGDVYFGLSSVNLFEALPGGLTQGLTGVRRDFQNQGIGTSLLLHTIEYAAKQNYKVIQAFNRPVERALLSLNEKLGFKVVSGNVILEKCLKEVSAIDPRIYDDYAGNYLDDQRPDFPMVVRNEGGHLTIESGGQKVELFPTSETEFFVKQFYGEATFVRDAEGQVSGMDFMMPDYKTRKRYEQHARRIS